MRTIYPHTVFPRKAAEARAPFGKSGVAGSKSGPKKLEDLEAEGKLTMDRLDNIANYMGDYGEIVDEYAVRGATAAVAAACWKGENLLVCLFCLLRTFLGSILLGYTLSVVMLTCFMALKWNGFTARGGGLFHVATRTLPYPSRNLRGSCIYPGHIKPGVGLENKSYYQLLHRSALRHKLHR